MHLVAAMAIQGVDDRLPLGLLATGEVRGTTGGAVSLGQGGRVENPGPTGGAIVGRVM